MPDPQPPHPALPSFEPFDALRRHRALVGAGVYLFVSAVGALYYALLLREFGLDAFDYWEASDFLLAVFREPSALLFGLVALLLWFSMRYQRQFNDWTFGRAPLLGRLLRYERWRESRFWNASPGVLVSTAFALVWFVVVMGSVAAGAARDATRGEGERLLLRVGDDEPLRGVLLTATNRYLFVVVPALEPAAARVRVVPYEALAWIETCGARRGLMTSLKRRAQGCEGATVPAEPAAAPGAPAAPAAPGSAPTPSTGG